MINIYKKGALVLVLLTSLCSNAQPVISFSINNNSPSYSITCAQPVVSLTAVFNSASPPPVSYTWSGTSSVFTGSSVAINFPGIYTVVASASGFLPSAQTVAISVNTLAPQSVVSPTLQAVNCVTSASPFSLTATNPSVNVMHQVIAPSSALFSSFSQSVAYSASGIGTYTYSLVDLTNGCSVVKTFSIVTNAGVPTFTLHANPGYSLGCSSKSVCTVSIPSVVTMPTPGSPVQYAFLPPGSAGSPTFQPGFTQTTITTPGNWTVYVKDAGNSCVGSAVFSVLQNTISPILNPPSVPVLDCSAPNATVQLTSNVPSATYSWIKPGAGSVNGSSFVITANAALPSSSVLGTYTVSAVDPQNMCQSNLPLNILQNLYPPFAKITSLSNYFCDVSQVTLTNASTSGIPPGTFNATQPVIAQTWLSANSPAVQNSTTYTATGPGTYTMVGKDLNNGCSSQTVITLSECVSVEEYSGSQNVSDVTLWPNPSEGSFEIRFHLNFDEQVSCDLTDLTGRLVKTILPVTNNVGGEIRISSHLNGLSPGVYFVKLRAGEELVSRKLVLSH